MWRVDDARRCVLLLGAPEVDPEDLQLLPGEPVHALPPPQASQSLVVAISSYNVPQNEDSAPDVILHANKCAFELHLDVLEHRCPCLFQKLMKLQCESRKRLRELEAAPHESEHFTLRVLDQEEVMRISYRTYEPEPEECLCPVTQARERTKLDYVKCVGHRIRASSPSPVVVQRRKRLRQNPGDENQPPNEFRRAPRARNLFKDEEVLKEERYPSLLHVEIVGAELDAVVAIVEYLYRLRVRLMEDKNALHVIRLVKWLDLRNSTLLYYCLTIAARYVTTKTWAEMMLDTCELRDSKMQRVVCDDLICFLQSLQPKEYYEVLTDIDPVPLFLQIDDSNLLARVLVGMINNVRLLEFWRNVLNGLNFRLRQMFQTPEPMSLRRLHKHFAPDWKPYLERPPVEVHSKADEAHYYTILEFGKFQLQIRIDIMEECPILWRIIRSASSNLLKYEPDEIDGDNGLAEDPQFWLRGQMKIKYWRVDSNQTEVADEVMIQYQHCEDQYSQWQGLVPPTPETLAPAVTVPAVPIDGLARAQLRGKFFVWGSPICSIYHFLLQTTLFYAAPHSASSELSDLMIVSEMQRLPVETLVLVLRGERLRVPGGERTLLRCLNKMVFGHKFSCLKGASQSRGFNGRSRDVIRLYKCVRWCFVPLDDIIDTLKRSPRELQFYELILKGVQDTFRRFHRRRPFGWRMYRHAYMKNETNAIEFMIEAGENGLSPEYFPRQQENLSQESVASSTSFPNSQLRAHSVP